jgi:hypothetical protein
VTDSAVVFYLDEIRIGLIDDHVIAQVDVPADLYSFPTLKDDSQGIGRQVPGEEVVDLVQRSPGAHLSLRPQHRDVSFGLAEKLPPVHRTEEHPEQEILC